MNIILALKYPQINVTTINNNNLLCTVHYSLFVLNRSKKQREQKKFSLNLSQLVSFLIIKKCSD